jgi:uncharacterized LabA/DUF88 family protein
MSDRLRIAVFIDFDNIEIGVKNTLGAAFDAGLVLEALKERGEVVSKMAYSDWQRAGGYSRALTQHAIRMVQRNLTPGGDKNGADINLALDALEMAFTHPHINAFVIVGGDSDFISLVEKLKQYDKKVFVVGGQQFTSGIMQRNCHEFIAYENLIGAGRRGGSGRGPKSERADLAQVVPLVKRALKVMLERDVDPQLGLFKSTLLQLDSTFSERTFGAGSFRDFAQKLEKAGVLRVHQGKGGWLVAPAEGVSLDPVEGEARATVAEPKSTERDGAVPERDGQPVERLGDQVEGISEVYRIISGAGIKKWPLYLRHVKQLVRAQTPPLMNARMDLGRWRTCSAPRTRKAPSVSSATGRGSSGSSRQGASQRRPPAVGQWNLLRAPNHSRLRRRLSRPPRQPTMRRLRVSWRPLPSRRPSRQRRQSPRANVPRANA